MVDLDATYRKWITITCWNFAYAAFISLGLCAVISNAKAQQTNGASQPPTSSANNGLTQAEIAKQLHNPLSDLKEVIFQLDVLPKTGPKGKTEWDGTIQPVWPFELGQGWKLVTYSIVPIISQPSTAPSDSRTFGLGDTNFFGYFVPPNESGLIWGFGPALQLPTHTRETLGDNTWAAGPALIVGVQPGNWSIFGLFDNVWSFAGSGEKINEFSFQYQAVYLFPHDWFFITNWTIDADWKASSSQRWTIPIGGGLGRQFKIGNQQFQAYGQIGYNVVRPDDAARWRAITALTLVF